ncbi:MAG: two-component system sensor histidine kinase NtrB [Thermodesulfobacteriota bacterium]
MEGKNWGKGLSFFYLIFLSGIILTILIVNGLLEIQRTKNGFYHLLEREGFVLLQHFGKNILGAFSLLQAIEEGKGGDLEESIAEYLLDLTHRIDQMDWEKPLTQMDLQFLREQYLLSSIEIYDPKGNLLRSSPPPLSPQSLLKDLIKGTRPVIINFIETSFDQLNLFSIAIQRKMTPGIIALHLNKDQMKILLRHLAIQRAISDLSLREGILYISVQDVHFLILAHTDISTIGKKEEDPFLKQSLHQKTPLSRIWTSQKGEEIFEVVQAIHLNDQPIGLIRIGYLSKEVLYLLQEIKKRVALSILFFLFFGVFALTLIWINQNRNLKRMKEMEDRIQFAEKLSSLGHVAAGVAHEIRNPMNAIGMGLQRLRREFSPGEESKREEFLSYTTLIYREIQRINEIIEQFLNLSRPFKLNLKKVSLRSLLEHLIQLFKDEAASRRIDLKLELTDLPYVSLDEEKLTQAFINIIKNGMEAMENGGTFRILTRVIKNYVEIVFIDTGSGIAPDQIDRIFNYYYTTKEKGVGLGLPISHRIIEAHGGQLKLESQLGVGTRVTIILPIIKNNSVST